MNARIVFSVKVIVTFAGMLAAVANGLCGAAKADPTPTPDPSDFCTALYCPQPRYGSFPRDGGTGCAPFAGRYWDGTGPCRWADAR
jgi:hypothetical protein